MLLSLQTGAEQAVSSLAAAGPCCTGAGRPWAVVSSQPGRGARLSFAARLAVRETSPWKASAWKVLGAEVTSQAVCTQRSLFSPALKSMGPVFPAYMVKEEKIFSASLILI